MKTLVVFDILEEVPSSQKCLNFYFDMGFPYCSCRFTIQDSSDVLAYLKLKLRNDMFEYEGLEMFLNNTPINDLIFPPQLLRDNNFFSIFLVSMDQYDCLKQIIVIPGDDNTKYLDAIRYIHEK